MHLALEVTPCPARLRRPRSNRARWTHPTSSRALWRSTPARRECPQRQLSPTRWAQGQTWRRRTILGVQAAAMFAGFVLEVGIRSVRALPPALARPLDLCARLTLTPSLSIGRDAAALGPLETIWRF